MTWPMAHVVIPLSVQLCSPPIVWLLGIREAKRAHRGVGAEWAGNSQTLSGGSWQRAQNDPKFQTIAGPDMLDT